ncbi:MAG: helix-turn-helix domain-containing protein [Nitrospinae bacterium]|nr:helix-turn-helix domain-containing protein [Nitrospinota bacterium]
MNSQSTLSSFSGFLPLSVAATWAGVSPRTLKRWLSQGLPYHQAGPRTKVLIRPADIEKFLTRRQHPTPSLDALVNQTLAELGEKKKQNGEKAATQKRNGPVTQ